MKNKNFWSGALVVLLSIVLACPLAAQTGGLPHRGLVRNIVIGLVAAVVAVVVIILVVHKKSTITGCVNASGNGLSLTEEQDKTTYSLSGSTANIKAGERVKLKGKKLKSQDKGKPPVWEVDELAKDFGACHP
jgi:hypothetical protein